MNQSNDPNNDDIPSEFEEELQSPPEEVDHEDLTTDEIQEEAKERSSKAPFIQKIARVLRGDTHPYREIIINAESLEKRVAVLENGILEKFEMERTGEDRLVGAVFKGKIQNLEAGLKAAFVDIGMQKNAFLHYWDILPSANTDSTVEFVRDTRTEAQKNKRSKTTIKDIPDLYPIGSDIVVQITKGQIGSKGPRTTTNLSFPGRFLVLMPYSGQCGISRKIESDKERKRLKDIIKKLSIPEGMGIIIRTAGENKRYAYFVRDLAMLLDTWEGIQQKMEASKDPCCLYTEPDIVERTVRDFLTESVDRVLVDDQEDCDRMNDLVARISKRSLNKIAYYQESIPIFERFNIERQIEQTFQRRVTLPSGGEIVVEETEALVAVDVNTGAHKAKGDNSNFIVQVNLEAAKEVARQIRLRNIGGLIIIDFIDMKQRKDRMTVYKLMKQEMEKDKAKCHILQISQLGIMQMTRQRHKESTSSGLYTGCPYCQGRGIVKSARTMSIEIQRRLVSVIRRLRSFQNDTNTIYHLRIFCHPHALERLRLDDERHLIELEEAYNVRLAFRGDSSIHIENFKIVNAETMQELR
jgi:ribonuclease G